MKFVLIFKGHFTNFLILILIIFFSSFGNLQNVNAFTMDNSLDGKVTEELRLKVPKNFKEAWLNAEKNVWEPWLSEKEGFLDRTIFWNKNNEEALILVNWKNKKSWKSISIEEVNEIQKKFDESVNNFMRLDSNPLKLIYEAELYEQG